MTLRVVVCLAVVAAAMSAVVASGCSGGRGGGSAASCAELSLEACRATLGCAPDLCEGCSCTPNFRGCIPDGFSPSPCPVFDCPTPSCCGADGECDNGTQCYPPGVSPGCGACNPAPSSCQTDNDCEPMGATMICEPIECSCEQATACRPGCVDDSACDEGFECDTARSRCVARSCAGGDDCPSSFDCIETRCTRRSCESDDDCPAYCVLGRCYDERGTCTAPPP